MSHPYRELVLRSDALDVTLLPDKGCDVLRVRHRASETDVLFVTPWADAPAPVAPAPADTATAWLAAYRGGWQVLLPNAGPGRTVDGVALGFHGEAALVPWRELAVGPDRAVLETRLVTAPLHVHREVVLDGGVLRLTETVTNDAPDPRTVAWLHHPALGAPFLEEGCRLTTGARTVIADPEAPGTLLAAGSRHAWPIVHAVDGAEVDLRRVPGPGERREVFAALTDFASPFAAVVNPRRGLGVGLRWSADVFPHAWLWQEVHATTGFPWFRRAYVLAVEPSSVLSGPPAGDEPWPGGGTVLEGGEACTAVLELVVAEGDGEIVDVRRGGEVIWAEPGSVIEDAKVAT